MTVSVCIYYPSMCPFRRNWQRSSGRHCAVHRQWSERSGHQAAHEVEAHGCNRKELDDPSTVAAVDATAGGGIGGGELFFN